MYEAGRYQSRLLNLLNRRYRQLVKTGDRAVRQLRMTVDWTAQVMLYPVYLALQTTRLAFRQLKQAVQLESPQLSREGERPTPLPCDTPIQQVLVTTKTWVTSKTEAKGTQTSDATNNLEELEIQKKGDRQDAAIQGVATSLETKSLVVVSEDNQSLDILTPPQQEKLHQSIDKEIANYRRWQQLIAIGAARSGVSLQQIAKRNQLISPFRQFWQIMAWVERGTVAIAIDLFQESRLAIRPHHLNSSSQVKLSGSEPPSFLKVIDRQIAKVENYQLDLEGKGFNVYALIGAAIDYFFGGQFVRKQSERKLENPSQTANRITAASEAKPESPATFPKLASKNLESTAEANWLTMADLFAGSAARNQTVVKNLSSKKPATYQSKTTPVYRSARLEIPRSEPANSIARGDRYSSNGSVLQPKSRNSTRVKPRPLVQSKKEVLVSDSRTSSSAEKTTIATLPSAGVHSSSIWNADPIADWIETKATITGYVKHPLEILLEWLDLAILWLEELAIRVWKWLLQL